MTKQIMTLTEEAANKVKSFISQAAKENEILGLRIGVQSGGCSGMKYFLEYATQEREGEEVVEDKGIKLFIDKEAVIYLVGTEIHYDEGAFESRFVFRNPNESKRCGCGKSFQAA